MKFILIFFFGTLTSHAATMALDDASNYSSWTNGSNLGTGFSAWTFATNVAASGAGLFLANSGNTDLNGIATGSNNGFGTYANNGGGAGFQVAVAYRSFTGGSVITGQQFKVSIENGNITDGSNDGGNLGSMGVTLRTGNAAANVGDYNNGSRFEFAFLGGSTNYTLFDSAGSFDTGIPFTNAGLDLTFELITANTYNLNVLRKANSQTFTFTNRTLGGTSGNGLDSFALYNRNAENGNVYFNSLSVVPEPSRALLLLLGFAGCAFRRRR